MFNLRYPVLTLTFCIAVSGQSMSVLLDTESGHFESAYETVFSDKYHPNSLAVISWRAEHPETNEVLFLSSVFHLQQAVRASNEPVRIHHLRAAKSTIKKIQANGSTYFGRLANALLLHKTGKTQDALQSLTGSGSLKKYGLAYYVSLYLILKDTSSVDNARDYTLAVLNAHKQKKKTSQKIKKVIAVFKNHERRNILSKEKFQRTILANRVNKAFLMEFTKRFRQETVQNQQKYYQMLVELISFQSNSSLYEFAGDLSFHLNRFDAAGALYGKSLKLEAENGVVLHKLGLTCLEKSNPTEAQKHLAKALSLRAEDASIKYSLARALALQGKLSEAEYTMRQAWSKWPKSREMYLKDPDLENLRVYLQSHLVSH